MSAFYVLSCREKDCWCGRFHVFVAVFLVRVVLVLILVRAVVVLIVLVITLLLSYSQ